MLSCLASLCLAGSSAYGVTIEPLASRWIPNRDTWFNVVVSPQPLDGELTAPKGTWEGKSEPFRAIVELWRDGKIARKREFDVSPKMLAEVARGTPPDRYIWSHRDPNAVVGFRVPAELVRAGRYRIEVKDASSSQTLAQSDEIVVKPVDWARLAWNSRLVGSLPPESKFVPLGNPGLAQFPAANANDCQARSVWCLGRNEGRILVGYGDWALNRGPIKVWSFDAKGTFRHEYTTQENSVDMIRADGKRALLPGFDGLKGDYPDGAAFGNLYIRENERWRKLSTIPDALHVTDVAVYGKDLFVLADSPYQKLFRSTDDGLNWKEIPGPMPQALVGSGLGMIVFSREGFTTWTPRKSAFKACELLPGATTVQPHRLTNFKDKILYTSWHGWLNLGSAPRPLYLLDPRKGEVRVVSLFRDKTVQDISADGDRVRILVGSGSGNRFVGEIYESQDLRGWRLAARFLAPALPISLASLDGHLFVGTANRGYSYEGYSDFHLTPYAYADAASGTIGVIRSP